MTTSAMMTNYYNEFDPKAAAWLRELIAAGEIPPGDVDERSITEVRPHEISHYVQHHFFAGIGGWPLAMRLAGWPDSKPVRTGSCPCQPFSIAGHGLGEADERHLWPNFRDLITFGEPAITFGEQVASAAGRDWLAGVRADLEGLGYEVGAADLCAASVGAPHPRQRLFWMANPSQCRWGQGSENGRRRAPRGHATKERLRPSDGREFGGVVLADGAGLQSGRQTAATNGHGYTTVAAGSHDPWDEYDIAYFPEGKARRIEPGTFPLADGVSERMVLLRGYGNAVVAQVAAEFIKASLEAIAMMTNPEGVAISPMKACQK